MCVINNKHMFPFIRIFTKGSPKSIIARGKTLSYFSHV